MTAKTNFKTLVPGATGDAGTLNIVSPFDGSIIGSVRLAERVFYHAGQVCVSVQRIFAPGSVIANDHTAFRVDWMPFGGLRESGLGVGGIPHTMQNMQVRKSLILQSPSA